MKFRHLSVLLFFVLFVHHSSEQGIDSDHLGIPSSSNGATYDDTSSGPNGGGATGTGVASSGLADVLRNRTNSILQRLEGPRDRVLEFIRPAVKSDFSRNVTNVLNSIWSRVQESNSSIINNPLFRNSVVIPINTTLSRLKQITAADNDNSALDNSNLEIINLNKPEDEAHLREYLRPASSAEEAVTRTPVIFLFREEEKERTASASENVESTELPASKPAEQPHDEVSNSDDTRVNDESPVANEQPQSVDQHSPSAAHNPTKSVKKARRSL